VTSEEILNHNSFLDFVEKQANLKSKCISRKVGAALVFNDRIISTGINGTPPGFINCCDVFNVNDINYKRDDHSRWSKDHEIHAEMNCLLNASKISKIPKGCYMYSNYSPCRECLKNLSVLKIDKFYFRHKYDGIGYDFDEMKTFAKNINIDIVQIPEII
jgi:dCMP deaminase